MTASIPMSVVYTGLAATLLALIVAMGQQKWQLRVFFLLALRLAIGWHFLFEGLHKINTHCIGLSETNKPFSSEPYFKAAPTRFGEMMRKKYDDPAAVISARLTPRESLPKSEFEKLSLKEQSGHCPEPLRLEFDALLEAAEAHVKAEAAADKSDAKKAYDKELTEIEDNLRLAQEQEKQAYRERLVALRTAHWAELSGIDDAAKRQEMKAAHDGRLKEIEQAHLTLLTRLTAEAEKRKTLAADNREKKEKNADEKRANFKEIASARIESAKAAFAAWVLGFEGRDSKVKFTSGEAALSAPQRLAHLEWLRSEARAAQDRAGSGIGNGNGIEVRRAAELRMELLAAEAELARDAYAPDIKKALTGKDWERPKAESEGARIDRFTMWFIAVVGACLLFGIATRLSCLLAAGFLVLTYLTHPAVPWYPLPPNTEGNPLFINKNVIECLALLSLACFPTGSWLGLDALFSRLFRKTEAAA